VSELADEHDLGSCAEKEWVGLFWGHET
jgi:hypothetical protein